HQTPNTRETPNTKLQATEHSSRLELGAWDFFGVWSLVFGGSISGSGLSCRLLTLVPRANQNLLNHRALGQADGQEGTLGHVFRAQHFRAGLRAGRRGTFVQQRGVDVAREDRAGPNPVV